MARAAGFDSAERNEDDAWFDEGGAMPHGAARDRKARVVLGVTLVALVLLGIMLGAFSGSEAAPGPDLERLRERARVSTNPTPLQAGGSETLLTGLERLVTAMPTPAPVADVVSAPPNAADAVVVAEVDAAPTVAAVEPKPKVVEPKVGPPKVVEPRVVEPKVVEPKVVEPKVVEPKVVEPKGVGPKVVEDPKLKGPVDQALADAKAHLDGGRWAEAKSGYEKVLGLSPGNTRALLGRGRALLELRQVQPALKDIKAVLEVEPRNRTALLLAGSISQELGQKDQARGFYQRYLDAWPSGRKAAEVKALLERL